MDPTAPKDNPPKPQSPPAGGPPASPSLGGPTPAPANPWSSSVQPQPDEAQKPPSPIQPGQFVAVGDDTPAPRPDALPPLAQTSSPPLPSGPILGATPPSAPEPPLPSSPPAGGPPPPQPDPTPYVPPPQGQASQVPPSGSASKIKKLRLVIIVAGVLVLVAITAVLVWFFVLGERGQAAKTKSASDLTEISEPSPPPKITQGGFGDLPQGTGSATPSAQ